MLYVIQCADCERPFISTDLGEVALDYARHRVATKTCSWEKPYSAVLTPEGVAPPGIEPGLARPAMEQRKLAPGHPLTIYARSHDGYHELGAVLEAAATNVMMELGPKDRSAGGTYRAYIARDDLVTFAERVVALLGSDQL